MGIHRFVKLFDRVLRTEKVENMLFKYKIYGVIEDQQHRNVWETEKGFFPNIGRGHHVVRAI